MPEAALFADFLFQLNFWEKPYTRRQQTRRSELDSPPTTLNSLLPMLAPAVNGMLHSTSYVPSERCKVQVLCSTTGRATYGFPQREPVSKRGIQSEYEDHITCVLKTLLLTANIDPHMHAYMYNMYLCVCVLQKNVLQYT